MQKSALTYALALYLILTLAACSGSTGPAQTTQAIREQPLGPTDQPYPYPLPILRITPTSPYPGPQAEPSKPVYPSTPLVIPPAGENTGVVTGRLVDEQTGGPLAYQSVYLADKIPLTPGPGYTLGIQERSSPHALTNEKGQFAIGDIPPGTYVMMVWTPFNASVVIDQATGKELEVSIVAGQILDLGDLPAISP